MGRLFFRAFGLNLTYLRPVLQNYSGIDVVQ